MCSQTVFLCLDCIILRSFRGLKIKKQQFRMSSFVLYSFCELMGETLPYITDLNTALIVF